MFALLFSVILPDFYYCNLSMYDQNVTTTTIGLSQHSTGCLVVCFPGMTSSLAKVNKSSDAHFQMLFSKIVLFFDVPQYYNRFDYIKDRRQAVYFNNQKIISPLRPGQGLTSLALSELKIMIPARKNHPLVIVSWSIDL